MPIGFKLKENCPNGPFHGPMDQKNRFDEYKIVSNWVDVDMHTCIPVSGSRVMINSMRSAYTMSMS